MKVVLFGLFMLLLLSNQLYSLQSEDYLNYIANLTYSSCAGQNIKLKETWFISADNSRFITEINWPYSPQQVKEAIDYISRVEPYSVTNNMFMQGSIQVGNKSYTWNNVGENILTCGENKLDVYNREYYWDTRRIDLPRNLEVQSGAQATFGDRSPIINSGNSSQITTGDNSPIATSGSNSTITQNETNSTINFWSNETLVGGIIGTIIGGVAVHILSKRYDTWKKRK
jgi:hypothetical protein